MYDVKRDESLKLGDKAKDKITGFTGIVCAITEWLNGCRRITIQPQEVKDGKVVDSHTFDAEQIEKVTPDVIAPMSKTGGEPGNPTRTAGPTR